MPSSKLEQQPFTLHSLAQVVSPPLFVDDRLIDLAGGQVVVSGQPDVEETFVVAQIQVYLAPVIQHEHFPWTSVGMTQSLHKHMWTFNYRSYCFL